MISAFFSAAEDHGAHENEEGDACQDHEENFQTAAFFLLAGHITLRPLIGVTLPCILPKCNAFAATRKKDGVFSNTPSFIFTLLGRFR